MIGTVAIPLLLGAVVDAVEQQDRDPLLPLALAIIGAGIARLALAVPRRLISGRVSLGVEYDLRNRLYRHLQSLELGFFDRQQTGQLMSRVTVDLQSVRFFLGYGLIFILQNLLTILLAAIVMFVLQPSLAAITLAPVPLVVLAAARYGRQSRPALQEVQQRIAELTAEAEESISGIRVVKAFAREDGAPGAVPRPGRPRVRPEHVLHPAARLLQPDDLLPAEPRAGRGAAGRRPAGRERDHHAGRVRHLQHLPPDADVPDADARHRARDGAAGRGLGKPRVRDPRPRAAAAGADATRSSLPPGGGRIEVRAATLSYNGGPPALDGVTLDVAPGETLAIVGPTGSGKTTLVAAVARLYDLSGGSIAIDGVDVRRIDPSDLRRAVALVPDDGFLFSATVRENISYARPDATLEEVELAARRAQIHSFVRVVARAGTTRSSASAD